MTPGFIDDTPGFLGDRRPEHSGSALVREAFRVTNAYAPRLLNGTLDSKRIVVHAESEHGASIGMLRVVLASTDAVHLREGSIISVEFMLSDTRDDRPAA